jgi:hypothetical protein
MRTLAGVVPRVRPALLIPHRLLARLVQQLNLAGTDFEAAMSAAYWKGTFSLQAVACLVLAHRVRPLAMGWFSDT